MLRLAMLFALLGSGSAAWAIALLVWIAPWAMAHGWTSPKPRPQRPPGAAEGFLGMGPSPGSLPGAWPTGHGHGKILARARHVI